MNLTLDRLLTETRVRRELIWENPAKEKNFRALSFLLAFAFHAILLFAGGAAFVHTAEYGIESAQGGIELYLVAALPQANPDVVEMVQQPELIEDVPDAEVTTPVLAQEKRIEEKPQEKQPPRVSEDSEHVGDGSSPEPGIHSTTFYSEGGGSTDEKAGHLKNPPPPYPADAVERGQEGLVMISVLVDRTGRPSKVEVQQSSGFRLLDESARTTIRRWKFNPGRTGFLATESHVIIPIRFELKNAKKITVG